MDTKETVLCPKRLKLALDKILDDACDTYNKSSDIKGPMKYYYEGKSAGLNLAHNIICAKMFPSEEGGE